MENKEKSIRNILNEAKKRRKKEIAITRMTETNKKKPNITINDAIRNIRVSRNLTQAELAKILGISQNGVSNIEQGRTLLTLPKIKEIAKALDISYSDLLSNVEGFEEEKVEFEEKKENEQITLLEQEIKAIRLRCAKKIKQVSKELTERHIEEKRLLRETIREKDKVITLLEDKIRLLENR